MRATLEPQNPDWREIITRKRPFCVCTHTFTMSAHAARPKPFIPPRRVPLSSGVDTTAPLLQLSPQRHADPTVQIAAAIRSKPQASDASAKKGPDCAAAVASLTTSAASARAALLPLNRLKHAVALRLTDAVVNLPLPAAKRSRCGMQADADPAPPVGSVQPKAAVPTPAPLTYQPVPLMPLPAIADGVSWRGHIAVQQPATAVLQHALQALTAADKNNSVSLMVPGSESGSWRLPVSQSAVRFGTHSLRGGLQPPSLPATPIPALHATPAIEVQLHNALGDVDLSAIRAKSSSVRPVLACSAAALLAAACPPQQPNRPESLEPSEPSTNPAPLALTPPTAVLSGSDAVHHEAANSKDTTSSPPAESCPDEVVEPSHTNPAAGSDVETYITECQDEQVCWLAVCEPNTHHCHWQHTHYSMPLTATQFLAICHCPELQLRDMLAAAAGRQRDVIMIPGHHQDMLPPCCTCPLWAGPSLCAAHMHGNEAGIDWPALLRACH
jgi:hypothetical protein